MNITADGQNLTGNLVVDDDISSIIASLTHGSTLTGAINTTNKGKAVNLTLDSSSSCNVTAESYRTCLTDSNGFSRTSVNNITGNGHAVYYNASACNSLAGQTYILNGGGYLKPTQ